VDKPPYLSFIHSLPIIAAGFIHLEQLKTEFLREPHCTGCILQFKPHLNRKVVIMEVIIVMELVCILYRVFG
jgi:hypothetical protein